ncbi:glycosyltransferase [Clostridiales bacterium]|nr:glycosyltransferase [Clostridiales bacterium]
MIVACTVSFNSSVIIEKTIDSLLSQSFLVDKIVIADNCSNEENKARLKSYLDKSPTIDIIWLNKNSGGAGGFYEAMKYAKEQYDPDWYWLMDDDAYPNPNCLEILLEQQKQLDNVGFVAPVIWGIDNQKYQLYHPRKEQGKANKFSAIAETIGELNPVEIIDIDAFVGPLISKEAVNSCGLPRPGYFLEGDDMDYTFRITRQFKGYLIKTAQINHKDLIIANGINPGMWWKQYYSYRNPIIFAKYNYHGTKKRRYIFNHLLFASKQIIKMYLDNRYKGYRLFRSKLLIKGILDGLKRKEGIVVVPSEYKQSLTDMEMKMKSHIKR